MRCRNRAVLLAHIFNPFLVIFALFVVTVMCGAQGKVSPFEFSRRRCHVIRSGSKVSDFIAKFRQMAGCSGEYIVVCHPAPYIDSPQFACNQTYIEWVYCQSASPISFRRNIVLPLVVSREISKIKIGGDAGIWKYFPVSSVSSINRGGVAEVFPWEGEGQIGDFILVNLFLNGKLTSESHLRPLNACERFSRDIRGLLSSACQTLKIIYSLPGFGLNSLGAEGKAFGGGGVSSGRGGDLLSSTSLSMRSPDDLIYLFRGASIVASGLKELANGRKGNNSGKENHPSFTSLDSIKNIFLTMFYGILSLLCFYAGLFCLIYCDSFPGSIKLDRFGRRGRIGCGIILLLWGIGVDWITVIHIGSLWSTFYV
jgi:hypothetical protein